MFSFIIAFIAQTTLQLGQILQGFRPDLEWANVDSQTQESSNRDGQGSTRERPRRVNRRLSIPALCAFDGYSYALHYSFAPGYGNHPIMQRKRDQRLYVRNSIWYTPPDIQNISCKFQEVLILHILCMTVICPFDTVCANVSVLFGNDHEECICSKPMGRFSKRRLASETDDDPPDVLDEMRAIAKSASRMARPDTRLKDLITDIVTVEEDDRGPNAPLHEEQSDEHGFVIDPSDPTMSFNPVTGVFKRIIQPAAENTTDTIAEARLSAILGQKDEEQFESDCESTSTVIHHRIYGTPESAGQTDSDTETSSGNEALQCSEHTDSDSEASSSVIIQTNYLDCESASSEEEAPVSVDPIDLELISPKDEQPTCTELVISNAEPISLSISYPASGATECSESIQTNPDTETNSNTHTEACSQDEQSTCTELVISNAEPTILTMSRPGSGVTNCSEHTANTTIETETSSKDEQSMHTKLVDNSAEPTALTMSRPGSGALEFSDHSDSDTDTSSKDERSVYTELVDNSVEPTALTMSCPGSGPLAFSDHSDIDSNTEASSEEGASQWIRVTEPDEPVENDKNDLSFNSQPSQESGTEQCNERVEDWNAAVDGVVYDPITGVFEYYDQGISPDSSSSDSESIASVIHRRVSGGQGCVKRISSRKILISDIIFDPATGLLFDSSPSDQGTFLGPSSSDSESDSSVVHHEVSDTEWGIEKGSGQKILIHGVVYDTATGLFEHPDQDEPEANDVWTMPKQCYMRATKFRRQEVSDSSDESSSTSSILRGDVMKNVEHRSQESTNHPDETSTLPSNPMSGALKHVTFAESLEYIPPYVWSESSNASSSEPLLRSPGFPKLEVPKRRSRGYVEHGAGQGVDTSTDQSSSSSSNLGLVQECYEILFGERDRRLYGGVRVYEPPLESRINGWERVTDGDDGGCRSKGKSSVCNRGVTEREEDWWRSDSEYDADSELSDSNEDQDDNASDDSFSCTGNHDDQNAPNDEESKDADSIKTTPQDDERATTYQLGDHLEILHDTGITAIICGNKPNPQRINYFFGNQTLQITFDTRGVAFATSNGDDALSEVITEKGSGITYGPTNLTFKRANEHDNREVDFQDPNGRIDALYDAQGILLRCNNEADLQKIIYHDGKEELAMVYDTKSIVFTRNASGHDDNHNEMRYDTRAAVFTPTTNGKGDDGEDEVWYDTKATVFTPNANGEDDDNEDEEWHDANDSF